MDLYNSIRTENIELVKEFVKTEKPENHWADSEIFGFALHIGNLEIIKILVEAWTDSGEYEKPRGSSELRELVENTYDTSNRLEIIEYLLPHIYTEDPKRPGFCLIDELYGFILDCSFGYCPFLLMEYFFNNYYTEEHNALYPLLNKIKTKLDEINVTHCSYYLLHSDIKSLEDIGSFFVLYDLESLLSFFIYGAFERFSVAIELSKFFLEKHIDHVDFESIFAESEHLFEDGNLIDEPVKFSSFEFKRLFQFVYCSLDSENFIDGMALIERWFVLCFDYQKFYEAHKILLPFITISDQCRNNICQKLENKENTFEVTQNLFEISLVIICEREIKRTIFEVAKLNPKETINRIWSLPLPDRIKCDMLCIHDASWMNELQENLLLG